MNIVQFKKTLHFYTAIQMPIFVVSGPGLGKSEAYEQVATEITAKGGVPHEFLPLVASNFDPWDLIGFNVPLKKADNTLSADMTAPFYWDRIAHWDGVNCTGTLLLDEAGDAENPTQKVLARIVNNREIGTRKLPAGCSIGLAGNRRKDRSGVQRMASMFQNRFCQIELEFNADLLLEHLQEHEFHEAGLSFIKLSPQFVYSENVPDEPGPFVSPRSFEKGIRALTHLAREAKLDRNSLPGVGDDDVDVIARSVLSGWIGAGASAQFFAHLKYQHELPTMEEIVLDPAKAKLPKSMGAQYMVSFMLGARAQNKALEPVIRYFRRLGVEFQVVTMKRLIDRQQKGTGELTTLFNTPGVTDWLNEHRKVIMNSAS